MVTNIVRLCGVLWCVTILYFVMSLGGSLERVQDGFGWIIGSEK